MAKFIDKDGTQQELQLSPTVYKEALLAGVSVPQFVNRKYPTASEHASTFDQLCASSGLIVKTDKEFGIRPPTLGALLDGRAELSGASNVLDADPASRILYPAVVLEMMEDAMVPDRETDVNAFDSMVAKDTGITSNRYEWPVVSLKRAEAARSKVISQLAEPSLMMTITSADSSKSLLTTSLGLEVSDQALQATTLDFVTMAVGRQMSVERNAKVYDYLLAFLNGDADMGQSALSTTNADVFDTSIAANGVVTKLALVKWLVNGQATRKITHIVTDIAGVLAIEAALASTHTGVYVEGALVPQFSLMNRVLSGLNVFVVEDGMGWPANTIMGLDSSAAIHRVRNSAAAYSAVEQFVMRRSTQLRFDSAEIAYRLFDDAFSVMTLINS